MDTFTFIVNESPPHSPSSSLSSSSSISSPTLVVRY